MRDSPDRLAGQTAVVSGGEGFGGVGDVDQVVRDAAALGWRGLGGSDLHLSVDGNGVATDDLSGEALGEAERERGLAAGGGAKQHD